MLELKAGDLCIIGSDAFADYREQLVSWETYHQQVAEYGATADVPVDGPTFVGHVRDWLAGIAQATDEALPTNRPVRIEYGEPIITRLPCKTESSSVRDREARLAEHMPEE